MKSEFKFWHQGISPLRSLTVSSDMGKLEKAPSFCSTGISCQRKKTSEISSSHASERKKPSLERACSQTALGEAAKAGWRDCDQQDPHHKAVPTPHTCQGTCSSKHIRLNHQRGCWDGSVGTSPRCPSLTWQLSSVLGPWGGGRKNSSKFPLTSKHTLVFCVLYREFKARLEINTARPCLSLPWCLLKMKARRVPLSLAWEEF